MWKYPISARIAIVYDILSPTVKERNKLVGKGVTLYWKFIVGESSKVNSETQHIDVDADEGITPTNNNLAVIAENIPKGTSEVETNVNKVVTDVNNGVNDASILVPNPNPHVIDNPLEAKGSSETEYVDATQLINCVPKTQLDEGYKKHVT